MKYVLHDRGIKMRKNIISSLKNLKDDETISGLKERGKTDNLARMISELDIE